MNFAKLFTVEGIGQIVVMRDTNDDDNPAVKVFFQPPELGVCCVSLAFTDTDAGWENRDTVFENMDEARATELVSQQLELIGSPA